VFVGVKSCSATGVSGTGVLGSFARDPGLETLVIVLSGVRVVPGAFAAASKLGAQILFFLLGDFRLEVPGVVFAFSIARNRGVPTMLLTPFRTYATAAFFLSIADLDTPHPLKFRVPPPGTKAAATFVFPGVVDLTFSRTLGSIFSATR
jgi:hypothetical protein